MQQLYALKQDLDMVTEDVLQLKRGYSTLDFIAQTVKNTWEEQVIQGEQMRRMEIQMKQMAAVIIGHDGQFQKMEMRLNSLESRLNSLESRLDSLESRLDSLETRLDSLETRLDSLETRLDSLETNVIKILKHFNIN